ncbi:hypothetical protein AXG93_2190s1290 [Marchantia polymorpha subsp. ruderalis]|uniref:Uncharacterized protein n=1 Tax=Marchantia polymorpha subsp. ruderalis TaxID=1480154 RepID=A0A176WGV1_MARPO|nr:hypothetical protein AXG93_2190s1290 [Marchantia polymorpha subsp. ruderalis]
MEATNDEETLGGNEVASEEYDTTLALPSIKVNKSEDEVKERPKKKKVPLELSDTAEGLVDRVVEDVKRTMTEQQPMPLAQVSSRTIDLDCGGGPSAEEPKLVGLSVADMLAERVIALLSYLDGKMAKYAELAIAGSYVNLMHSKTQTKEKRLCQTKLECAKLWKSLAVEKNLRASSERDCTSLRVDIENAHKATVDLWDRLEASRVAFNKESHHVDELIADLAKRDHLYGVELAANAKELADCEAARFLELEQRKRLEADCNEMRSQLSAVEEQLILAEARLLKTEAKN